MIFGLCRPFYLLLFCFAPGFGRLCLINNFGVRRVRNFYPGPARLPVKFVIEKLIVCRKLEDRGCFISVACCIDTH